jgi:hypothetical protein
MLCLVFLSSTPVQAGCWACGSDDCCKEAIQGYLGKDTCTNAILCSISCTCYWCTTRGNSCDGEGEPPCPSPLGACEEHQTFLTVPNGEPVPVPSPGTDAGPLLLELAPRAMQCSVL